MLNFNGDFLRLDFIGLSVSNTVGSGVIILYRFFIGGSLVLKLLRIVLSYANKQS